jgi:hypothetical protein
MKTTHKIIIGDSRWMKDVPDEAIHITRGLRWKNTFAYIVTVLLRLT